VARCPVERLMASSVLPARSAASSRAPPSPIPQASRPADLVERQVTAQRPNALWVADLTYIRTWSDYAALVIDAFSRAIVGWQLAGHLRTDLALDAPEMAIWQRNAQLDGLVHPATTMGSNQAGLRCRCRRRGPEARRTRPLPLRGHHQRKRRSRPVLGTHPERVGNDGDPGPAPSPAVRSLAQSQSSRTVMYQPGRSAGATVKCAWPWPLRCDATGKSWVNAQV
jgi:hypothetical protein